MKNKKKVNYKVLTIIIVVAVLIIAVLSFLFIKNKNVIIKQGEKEGELLQASYTGTISKTIFGTSTSISYEANEYNNSIEDSTYPYWQYYSFKIDKKKFNYTWLGGKCGNTYSNSNYGSDCITKSLNNFSFYSFYSNGYKYVAVSSSPVKVAYHYLKETPPYTATVFLETENEYQMVFEVPTPRYVQFDLSTSNFGYYFTNSNFKVNTSEGYLQYLAMSTTPDQVDVHKVTFSAKTADDKVIGQESGSIKMS